jgi:MFS family permease
LGPTVGGLIVHWLSWRDIFFVNVPVGIAALWLGQRHMPDYRSQRRQPLDVAGFLLFGAGAAILSWLLEIFGEHHLPFTQISTLLCVAVLLLAGYGWHARRTPFPLLQLSLFGTRTFRIAVLGGFVTRLGVGGMPLLLPLLYQLGMRRPAWQSGLLMMPMAAGAMAMKPLSTTLLRRFGYRRVLIVNTVLIGATIGLFAQLGPQSAAPVILLLGLLLGLVNSLQFASMNSMAYADIEETDSAMASALASTMQQMSMSFGLACASLATAYFLADLPQTDPLVVSRALHSAFLTLAVLTCLSSLAFWGLHSRDGENLSGRVRLQE